MEASDSDDKAGWQEVPYPESKYVKETFTKPSRYPGVPHRVPHPTTPTTDTTSVVDFHRARGPDRRGDSNTLCQRHRLTP
ncbi:Hypothetical predicted protein [Pelobates cultripes]|uniref:Uncharacterized protein n=1 Tax=Pelobates cultripes TaxID=61616 RepID=A0AAD1VNT2_PELCU|nr:Hypothetical predicted protein [Pelobates cultripes]